MIDTTTTMRLTLDLAPPSKDNVGFDTTFSGQQICILSQDFIDSVQ